MNEKANDRQVGGTHYQDAGQSGGLQPWDLFGPDFLIGNAVKYIIRWRKKDGQQSLEKAKHYIQKLRECSDLQLGESNIDPEMVDVWLAHSYLSWPERAIVRLLTHDTDDDKLVQATAGVDYLMEELLKQAPVGFPSTVTVGFHDSAKY